MNTFIERNKQLLRNYSTAAQFVGQLLLLTGAIGIAGAVVIFLAGSSQAEIIKRKPLVILTLILPGILVLGIGQFIRHLIEPDYKPNWLLQYADKILYFYAAIAAAEAIWGYLDIWRIIQSKTNLPLSHSFRLVAFLCMLSLPSVIAVVFILIATGYILRQIISAMEKPTTEAPPSE